MIDLEDAQAFRRMRIAQAEGFEPRAQHDRLAHTAPDGLGQRLLGEAAARGDEQAQRPQAFVPRPLIGLEAAFRAENVARKRIAKDASSLQQLIAARCPAAARAVRLGRSSLIKAATIQTRRAGFRSL